ncbi:MAG: hypothetical protein MJ135_04115 [Oscillospiraceae bacterium]|nr:hypothetical protein [Oscillospiraceae bacterium]
MNKILSKSRVAFLAVLLTVMLAVYLIFLYQLQIIEGEEYYARSSAIVNEKSTITAARGNILDRYGRTLISNKEIYNLKIDTTKLFADDDPNATILALVSLVRDYGDEYTDDLPVSMTPPFEYNEDMTAIQRTMLEAYIKDKGSSLPNNPTAVDLMGYMRSRYKIDNNYTAEEMRIIAGVRYSINVRYAINTADYVFVEDASMKLITSIMETKLAGINVDRAYTREYQTKYAAHLLGYTGLMTQEEFERYSLLNYSTDAMVGKDGVEYAFENYLHGNDGTVIETKNSSGTVLATVYEKEPEPGNHVYLTIDLSLQEQMERILDSGVNILIKERINTMNEQKAMGTWTYEDGLWEVTGAAAVAVNVKTGEPLAICSWPTYDVSTIIENYAALLKEDNAPLFNRALNGAYAPGSTFKPCTAVAGLSKGIINTETLVDCMGVYTRYAADGYAPECWIWSSTKDHLTHPEENVTTALRDSCNYFFYTVGNDLGVDDLGEFAHAFGLGVSTGIELNEAEGNMSNQANHMDYAGAEWRIGDTLQAAIGQSDSVFTPLQLAEYVATVANSGTRYSASILKQVRSYDYSTTVFERGTQIESVVESADYNWDAVHQGMFLVANDWSNEAVSKYFIPLPNSRKVAAKTGTAQKGEGIINDGIFICYAPFHNPEIAIAIVVERGGAGANCAFMARQMMDVYFNMKSYSDSSEGEMSLLK